MSKVEKPYVLLVDDNEATCTLIAALLHREYTVEVAGDGLEAIEKLKTKHYDAILLDIRMPQLDGYGVLEYLKANRPASIPNVLIVTASLTQRELARVREYPICGIVPKPFEVDTLSAAVKLCVGGDTEGRPLGGLFFKNTMILLLADLLRQRWM
jgi:two-component system response regulator PilR (NtrC family)